ncbi:unnamed protein product [Ixodes persulcatus]
MGSQSSPFILVKSLHLFISPRMHESKRSTAVRAF